jgi:trimeric autotransporter adhesin
MSVRISDHIRSNVVGYIALFLFAMGGSAYALDGPLPGQNQVGSEDIINSEVKGVDIGAGEVKNGDIGTSEVKANNVAPDSLGGNKIVDRSVKNADLGLGASSSNTIADGGIEGIDVKNNTLTGAQIDESTLAGVPAANAWNLNGNSGTTSSDFLGTTDNSPLNLRVNNARGLRIEPASDGTNQSPNVIGGIADNSVFSNIGAVYAATIAGGGRSDPANPATANKVTDTYGTVGGGADNQAGDASGTAFDASSATVSGGVGNTASGFASTAVGGAQNAAGGNFSLAAGRRAKVNHHGAFVWADSNGFDFTSTAPNQFNVRSTGGVRLVSGIDGSGAPSSGVELPASGSGWSTLVNGQPFDIRVNGARSLRIDPASDGTNESPNLIGGVADNHVTPGVHSAVIGGGGLGVPSDPGTANRVTDHQGVVGGGANNQAGDDAGTVGDATLATVGGGGNNNATGELSTVGGGFFDTASGPRATVGGGNSNIASGSRATVPGGSSNVAQGDFSLAAGRDAQANHQGAFVWADSNAFMFPSTAPDQFSVRSTGGARLVSGIDGSGNPTSGLELPAGGSGWSTLVNGQPFDVRVNNSRGFRIDPAFDGSDQAPNVIGGTADNSVTAGVHSATIAGGGRGLAGDPTTSNQVTDDYGTVGGGGENLAGNVTGTVDDRAFATVSGGVGNTASGAEASVSGGEFNTASGLDAAVGGGSNNDATGRGSTVVGGEVNTAAGLDSSVVGGGQSLALGDYSLAAGFAADAAQDGTFVWADSSPFFFTSTAANQFSVRATGGVRFVSAVGAGGSPTAGVQLAPGNSSWSTLSDRASKRAIKPASGRRVLRKLASVPVSTWTYRAQDDSIRHIGPMAQDFYRAFGFGEDNKHIDSVDADGVALAGIKGLASIVHRQRARIRRQAEENRSQDRKIKKLERMVRRLSTRC